MTRKIQIPIGLLALGLLACGRDGTLPIGTSPDAKQGEDVAACRTAP